MRRTIRAFLGGRYGALIAASAAAMILASGTASYATPQQISFMSGAQACVALTFDDGPDATLTPKLLSILESKGVHATFFVLGWRVAITPDPLVRAIKDGDEVGNHTWDHLDLTSLNADNVLSELSRTDAVIKAAIGTNPILTRAPFGSMSARVWSITPRTYIAWNIDTLDWKYPDVTRITTEALKAGNGAIILMHDIHPRTIDAVPGIIDGFRARGIQMVTVSQLIMGACGGSQVAFGASAPAPAATPPAAVASAKPAATPTPPAPIAVAKATAAAAPVVVTKTTTASAPTKPATQVLTSVPTPQLAPTHQPYRIDDDN